MATVRETDSLWRVLVPIANLEISNDKPFLGCWEVGNVSFISREVAKEETRSLPISRKESKHLVKTVLSETKAFAMVAREGKPIELYNELFGEVREAANILAATKAYYGARQNTGFNILGYPMAVRRTALFIDASQENLTMDARREGSLIPWKLDNGWLTCISGIGIIELFDAVKDGNLDVSWMRQIRRAAACLGRSQMCMERVDAFLLNIFALETLLTRKGERNSETLLKRIKGISGWYLENKRPDYETEIKEIFRNRCEAVHDADYGQFTIEHLLLSDMYARNALLNVVINRGRFVDKDTMVSTLDHWVDTGKWPTDGSYKLKWMDKKPFSDRELNLPMW